MFGTDLLGSITSACRKASIGGIEHLRGEGQVAMGGHPLHSRSRWIKLGNMPFIVHVTKMNFTYGAG